MHPLWPSGPIRFLISHENHHLSDAEIISHAAISNFSRHDEEDWRRKKSIKHFFSFFLSLYSRSFIFYYLFMDTSKIVFSPLFNYISEIGGAAAPHSNKKRYVGVCSSFYGVSVLMRRQTPSTNHNAIALINLSTGHLSSRETLTRLCYLEGRTRETCSKSEPTSSNSTKKPVVSLMCCCAAVYFCSVMNSIFSSVKKNS